MRRGAANGGESPQIGDAWRSLFKGPDRLGALTFLLICGWFAVIPGSALLYLASLLWGQSDLIDEPSVYFEFAIGSFLFALIGFLWLRNRRGGIDWLDKRAGEGN